MSKQIIRDAGKWLARQLPAAEVALKRLYSALPHQFHDHPENFLERYFLGHNNVRFIQIGAHDGISGDPLRSNILENNAWSGVLVEPNPALFERLKANYAGRDGLTFRCAAVSDRQGSLPFYIFDDRGLTNKFPHWWTEISSLDRNHIVRDLPPEVHNRIREIEVPVLTVPQIIAEYGMSSLSLIAMDVEGHEEPILHSILNSDIRPEVLLFEHKHLAAPTLRRLLTAFALAGYVEKSYGRDTVFYLPVRTN